MPEYLSPGVYVEEIQIGGKPVEGVSTSTAGFLGLTERGPTTPQFVTSWLDYQRLFGSYFGSSEYLPYAVQGFFDNGGQRAYIARIVKANAAKATLRLQAGSANALTLTAVGEGAWGNRIGVKVTAGSLSGFKLSLFYWKQSVTLFDPEDKPKTLPRPAVTEVYDNLSVDVASADFYEKRVNGVSNLVVLNKLTGDNGQVPSASTIAPLSGGADTVETEGIAAAVTANTIKLAADAASTDDAYNGMTITIISGDGSGQSRKITDYVGSSKTATLETNWDATALPTTASTYRVTQALSYTLADYKRSDTNVPGKRKGLAGLAEIDDISIVYTPNATAITGLAEELITHCEGLKDRFAIFDAPVGSPAANLNPRSALETKYAAYYYPWLKVVDPDTGLLRIVPPGGHMVGIYARTDTERGVHKAPANETVRGAIDLEFQITKQEQDILNPRGVNVIRAFPGRGIRVWGARTLSSDPLWKYVNVRRLFNFLEESIDEGTQWVVFEPNDEKLWARVRRTITEFLTRVWRDGALMGTKPEEAFFVKVDRSTMTQDDIDNGRLVVLIGVAPVKPAEFVVFRIAQVSSGSEG